jgi:uncharacterized protein
MEVPAMLMDDATWQNQLIHQYLSRSLTHFEIDRELGNLKDDLLTPEPVLSYLRYNVSLETDTLNALGLAELAGKVETLRHMSAAANRFDLAQIGKKAAEDQVQDEHFPEVFNLPPPL